MKGRMPARRRLAIATCTLATAVAVVAVPAFGQDLQTKLGQTESELSQVRERKGVLSSELDATADRISRLQAEVAGLRNREAVLAQELGRLETRLDEAKERLVALRDRLRRAVGILEERLVAIYKSGEPDLITVLLQSDGFDDLLERTEYLQRLEEQDASIVERVRELRDQMRATVREVKAARDEVAARKRALESTRAELEAQSAALAAARSELEGSLSAVRERERRLEGDLSEISKQIEEQLGGSFTPLPAGPIRGGSGSMIWPVNGTLTSDFGPRWGRMHEGLDIAAPGGTPIRAAQSGAIVLAAYTGGYGNYTCIDHGGGLSTCYAHQSGFARTSGSVAQGTVTGYVGTTGSSTGNHLHFEVRVNGVAVDPMGYL